MPGPYAMEFDGKNLWVANYFENTLEIKDKLSTLIRVLLKKSEKESRAESTSNVKVDIPASNAS